MINDLVIPFICNNIKYYCFVDKISIVGSSLHAYYIKQWHYARFEHLCDGCFVVRETVYVLRH